VRPLVTDYLVVGGGATALSFVDVLLDESAADCLIVDRRERVGGHWNDAYPFVRLHQPSAWYGVPSRRIPEEEDDDARTDAHGAPAHVVRAYFEQLLRERFLPSGRVSWMPLSEYRRRDDGAHVIRSLVTGEECVVTVRRRVVDATLTQTEIPATHPPTYRVATDVSVIPPNALGTRADHDRTFVDRTFVVIGAGKTGIDSCLHLLDIGVPPSQIRWVMPRDAWFLDRANMQPGRAHLSTSLPSLAAHYEALATFDTLDTLFTNLEASGVLHRLDPSVQPTKCRGANVSRREMARLRTIEGIVRMGRVVAIASSRVVLEHGAFDVPAGTVFVDCSASAVNTSATMPVFEHDLIRLLMVSWGQPLFSAALCAFVESQPFDDAERNALCKPVLFPNDLSDWPVVWAATLANAAQWRQHPAVHDWVRRCRLNGPTLLLDGVSPTEPDVKNLLRQVATAAASAAARLVTQ
jgi:hypothetical protein